MEIFVTESNSMKPIGGVIAVRQNLFQSSQRRIIGI